LVERALGREGAVAKIVTMVAKVIGDNCTGCSLCVFSCPTVALTMRPRRNDEPGPGRMIAELNEADCYNAQNCLEMCPDDAIVMEALGTPFTVGFDASGTDADEVLNLCLRAGVLPDQRVCYCTETNADELAAAILHGADAPEKLSLATGARTGCTEICHFPIMRLLEAAGHDPVSRVPARGYQGYGIIGRLMDHVADDGTVDPDLTDGFPAYPIDKDVNLINFDLEGA
ncbi:MAG: 4Fe-4S dicluster domain-containing protein, partial [Actinomycetota bacterium]